MNREVLFRGKRIDNGEWVEGYFLETENPVYRAFIISSIDIDVHSCGMDILDSKIFEVIPETVGEFTGCTDKNGKKIFESDITKHRSNYSGNFTIAVVIYSDEHFLAMTDDNTGFSLSDRLEVIGNIHDNPELLEVR